MHSWLASMVFLMSLKLSVSHESSSLTFELPDNERMCFHEDFEGSRMYVLQYKVISGGNYDVDVKVSSPNGKHVYSGIKRQSDTVKFEISWGTYTFCFSNEFSSITHKIVYFEVRPEEHSPLAVEGGKKAPSANTQLEESTETIHTHATRVMMFQKAYRLSEAKGRNEADILNQRVQWWSLAQAIIILITGFGEILVLRRFFTYPTNKATVSTIDQDKQPEVVHAAPVLRP